MLSKLDLKDVVKGSEENTDLDFNLIHNECLIDLSEELQNLPIAIGKGKNSKGYYIPVLSYSNFMCIVGASKSMKTFLKSAFISAYSGGNAHNYFPDLKGFDNKDKFILDFDTEQGKRHVQRTARRIPEMTEYVNPFYKPFYLRGLSPLERFQFIEWIFNESEYKDNIGLSSIDGVADLLYDVNDLKESNKITNALMKWTEQTNSAMITVLHRNHGTQKPTGHLGSSVLKKAETVVFVEKFKDEFRVGCTSEYTRNEPFKDFDYWINENYLPYEIIESLDNSVQF